MSAALTPMEQAVYSVEKHFNEINAYSLNFKKEATFALQLLKGNDYLRSTAQSNPDSLENALVNIAAIGISLNPATKEAYLVPRGRAVCLDISAIGLIKLATDSGSILWGQAKLVYEKDTYENMGSSKEPLHKYKAFGDRGELIGGYVVVKTIDGDFLTEEMSIKECHDIRDRSDAWKSYKAGKAKSCPWATDEGEMVKKTIVKRASKYWPKSDRVQEAVSILNQHEGIDFSRERQPHVDQDAFSVEPPTEKDFMDVRKALEINGRTEEKLLAYINTQFKTELTSIEEMNSAQIEYSFRVLKGRPVEASA